MEGPKLVGLVHAKEEGPAAAAEAEIAQQTVRIWLNRSSFAAVVAQFDSLSLSLSLMCAISACYCKSGFSFFCIM
jgi:hypothetical protein